MSKAIFGQRAKALLVIGIGCVLWGHSLKAEVLPNHQDSQGEIANEHSVLLIDQQEISINADNPSHVYNVNFGNVPVNSRFRRGYKITNDGTTPLVFKKSVIWGADFDAFHTCNGSLQPGQSCNLDIDFWPLSEGFKTGELLVRFETEDMRFRLSGWGMR